MTDRRFSIELRLCSNQRTKTIYNIISEQIQYLLRKEAINDELVGLFVKNEDTGEELDGVVKK